MKSLVFSIAVAIFAGSGIAETVADPAREIPSGFLDPDTLGVIRIDLDQWDIQGLQRWALRTLQGAQVGPKDVKEFAEMIRGPVASFDNWAEPFKRAGGRKVYIVVQQPLLLNLPFVFVPLERGADPDALAAQLEAARIIHSGEPSLPTTQPKDDRERKLLAEAERARTFRAERIGNAVVYANQITLDRLRRGQPATRPASSTDALMEAGDTTSAVWVYMTPEAVRTLKSLAAEDNSSDSLNQVVQKLQWLRVNLQLGSEPKAVIEFRTTPGAGESVRKNLNAALQEIDSQERFARLLKGIPVSRKGDRVSMPLSSQLLGRMLVMYVREPATTQPTTNPSTTADPAIKS